MLDLQVLPQPQLVVFGPVCHFHQGVAAAQYRAQRHHNHLAQIMALGRTGARVRQLRERFPQIHLGFTFEWVSVKPILSCHASTAHLSRTSLQGLSQMRLP